MDRQAISDAWANQKAWVETTLLGRFEGLKFGSYRESVDKVDACAGNNTFGPGPVGSGTQWYADGPLELQTKEYVVHRFRGGQICPARFPNATTVALPFHFAILEAFGKFSYEQPCIVRNLFSKRSETNSGSGKIFQAITSGELSLNCRYGNDLRLINVTFNKRPTITIEPDLGGVPKWVAELTEYLTYNTITGLGADLESAFSQARFTQEVIRVVNRHLGVSEDLQA